MLSHCEVGSVVTVAWLILDKDSAQNKEYLGKCSFSHHFPLFCVGVWYACVCMFLHVWVDMHTRACVHLGPEACVENRLKPFFHLTHGGRVSQSDLEHTFMASHLALGIPCPCLLRLEL